MEYQVISGDSHVDMTWMPGDLWVANAPPRFQDTAPRVVETNAGPRWWAEGRQLGIQGGLAFSFNRAVKERSRRISAMSDAGFYEEGLHPTTPHLRLRDMERDGVEAEVLYGLSGTHLQFQDPELLRFMYQVYYQWAADFCASHPGRWAALAPLVIHDPEAAAEDLRYAARLGLKGADLPLSNSAKPLYHRDWDALWAAAAECGMPVSFHSLGLKPRPLEGDDVQTYKAQHENVRNAMFQLGGIEALGSILVSGACQRYPDFRFVLGECGISWIPFALERLDAAFAEKRGDFELDLSGKPSEFWHQHGHSTYQDEQAVATVLELVGEERVIWGSDYPHPDSVWPESQAVIERNLGDLPEEKRRKIICENAGRLYGFIA